MASGAQISPLEFLDSPTPSGTLFAVAGESSILHYKNFEEFLAQRKWNRTDFAQQLFKAQGKTRFFLNRPNFFDIAEQIHESLFLNKSSAAFQKHLDFFRVDTRIKANRFDYMDRSYFAMRSYERTLAVAIPSRGEDPEARFSSPIPASSLGFEFLLYNALLTDLPIFWKPLLEQVEELTWRKMVFDWVVLRNQFINGFSNNLSLLVELGVEIPEEPLERLQFIKNSKTLGWICDEEFNPDNWRSVRGRYDLSLYADLYCGWIRYRKKQSLDVHNKEYQKLKEVLSKIEQVNWRDLLLTDLQNNWVSVYVETSDYKDFNLALVGRIYDLNSTGELNQLSFLEIDPSRLVGA